MTGVGNKDSVTGGETVPAKCMAYHRTYHQFASREASFVIAPRDQDGAVRLYLGKLMPRGEPLGAFRSATAAFAAIALRQTGFPAWDSIDQERACAMAMEPSRWEHPCLAEIADRTDTTRQFDDPEQIPPLKRPKTVEPA